MARRIRFTPFLLVAGVFACGARTAEAADVPFAPPFLVLDGASRIAAADIDGDGDRDVMSRDPFGHVLWTENIAGDGTAWTAHTIATDASSAHDVAAADLDRDGDADIASVGADGAIRWYENTEGDGSVFVTATVAGTGAARFVVEIADVDRDGDADLVSAAGGLTAWYENTAGDGSAWTLRTVAGPGPFASSLDVHDVDGDGDPDVLAAANVADVVTWHENVAGDGSVFATHTIATAASGAEAASGVRAADVDRDGDADAVVILREGNAVLWYENTAGDGSAWAAHTISTVSTWGIAVFVGDLDADGDPDVVSAWLGPIFGGTVGLAWHENVGGGASWVTRTLVSGNDSYDAVVADLDGDGDFDLLANALVLDVIRWFRNDSIHRTACFAPRRPIASGTQAAPLFAPVASADLDGDGDLDALSGPDDNARLAWHENVQGDATAWTSHVITAAAGLVLYSIAPGDVDGDGDVDVVSNPAARATVFRNTAGNASAWTSEPATPVREESGNDLDLVDLDGDGDLDVLHPDDANDRLSWLDNPGTGAAWVVRTIATFVVPNQPEAADVDRDGDLDVVSRTGDGSLIWFANLGGALSWSPARTVAAAGHAPFLVRDVDADGDPDVLVARGGNPTQLEWLENSGGGDVWGPHSIDPASIPFARWQDAADLDGDGDLDVVVTGVSGVRWYENTAGNSTLWERHTVMASTNSSITSAVLGDLDRDGDLDAMTGINFPSVVGWASNEGGQVVLATVDQVPPSANNGDVFSMLRITATHGGRAGDSDLELARLGLRFQEDGASDPLSSAEANALVEELRVYRDADGNGTFDAGIDTLVATVPTLALTNGVQTIAFTDGDPNVRVAFGTPAAFFVVAQLTANANEQAPNQFRVVHLETGPSATTAEDRSADVPLATACPADFQSRIVGPVVPVELMGFSIE